jgi:hypothetical protein
MLDMSVFIKCFYLLLLSTCQLKFSSFYCI